MLGIALIIAVAALTGIVALLVSEKRTRLIAVLILILAVMSAAERIHQYLEERPRALLVLDSINTRMNRKLPSSARFEVRLVNSGDADATDLEVTLLAWSGADTLLDDRSPMQRLRPGQTVGKVLVVDQESFDAIWREEKTLDAEIRLAYSDHTGAAYSDTLQVYFDPEREYEVFAAAWKFKESE